MEKGEIWFADLFDGKGYEQKGSRPVLVVGNTNKLTTIVPLTKNLNRFDLSFTHIIESTKENGLKENSVVLVFQITTLDNPRFNHKIGRITKEQMKIVDGALKDYFGIS